MNDKHSPYSERLYPRITVAMRNLMRELVMRRNNPDFTENDLIREALRFYLDHQEDLLGSRSHFNKGFRSRLDELEALTAFQNHLLVVLLTRSHNALFARLYPQAQGPILTTQQVNSWIQDAIHETTRTHPQLLEVIQKNKTSTSQQPEGRHGT